MLTSKTQRIQKLPKILDGKVTHSCSPIIVRMYETSTLSREVHTPQNSSCSSLQIYHMIQKGNTFQISPLWGLSNCPFQHAEKWTTVLGLTHKTSDRPNTNGPNFLAMSQGRIRWSSFSQLDLDTQQFNIIIWCFFKGCNVKVFLTAVVQVKCDSRWYS